MDKIRLNDDSVFFPDITRYEDDDQVDRVYICGETGCGKSTYIKQYVQHFLAQYPKGTVLLFSSKQEDKSLDGIKQIKRVKIDDDIHVNPYTLKEISSNTKPTPTIFDDVEDFANKKINNEGWPGYGTRFYEMGGRTGFTVYLYTTTRQITKQHGT